MTAEFRSLAQSFKVPEFYAQFLSLRALIWESCA